ncbi:MAG: amidohydrolase [Chitinophagaceae bacterium]|nr:MAG: amidohydrolase [Chitinophagaceae bacterium]
MFNNLRTLLTIGFLCALSASCQGPSDQNKTGTKDSTVIVLKNLNLIDGTGSATVSGVDIIIRQGLIAEIGKDLKADDAMEVDYKGKTVMPALISGHVHIGNLRDTTTVASNYTRQNILAQVEKYAAYGVLNVMVMGSDRALLFENGFYDSLHDGKLNGARVFSAGYGFGTPKGLPPFDLAMDNVNRPLNVEQAIQQVDSLVKLKPAMIKMWVDDGGGKFPKMDSAVSANIIIEAKKKGISTAAHVFYQSDAKRLIRNGLKVIAHSIRDTIIDDELIELMKKNDVLYIPTLTLDEYAYIYGESPSWMNNEFFKRSLEPGVFEMISSPAYQQKTKTSPAYPSKVKAWRTAMANLFKVYKAGITVVMGTDSGAMPIRAQGFSEHRELQLLVQAGLTPLQAITTATKNGALMLGIADRTGTIEKGKVADLLILEGNPSVDISNTKKIYKVYKAGIEVR